MEEPRAFASPQWEEFCVREGSSVKVFSTAMCKILLRLQFFAHFCAQQQVSILCTDGNVRWKDS